MAVPWPLALATRDPAALVVITMQMRVHQGMQGVLA
jgi:hypothetical protein